MGSHSSLNTTLAVAFRHKNQGFPYVSQCDFTLHFNKLAV